MSPQNQLGDTMKMIRAFFASIEADKKALMDEIESRYVKAADIYEGI